MFTNEATETAPCASTPQQADKPTKTPDYHNDYPSNCSPRMWQFQRHTLRTLWRMETFSFVSCCCFYHIFVVGLVLFVNSEQHQSMVWARRLGKTCVTNVVVKRKRINVHRRLRKTEPSNVFGRMTVSTMPSIFCNFSKLNKSLNCTSQHVGTGLATGFDRIRLGSKVLSSTKTLSTSNIPCEFCFGIAGGCQDAFNIQHNCFVDEGTPNRKLKN